MPKSKFQIFVASTIALSLLTGCAIKKRFIGLPGSSTAEGSRAVTDGGIKIPGWQGKIDDAEVNAGMTIADAKLVAEAGALHVTTGPAVSYWRTGATAVGNFTVSATFTEPKFMNLNSHPHPYGVFVGGNEMGTSSQTAFYCGAYGDGRFIARGFGPAPFRLNGLFGAKNEAVHKASAKGQPVTQNIAISVTENKVTCSINGTAVSSFDKAQLIRPDRLKSFNAYYGLRFAHNTDVFVTNLKLQSQ